MTRSIETRSDLAFDHVIHVVQNPDETRRLFERELSVHTVPGGEHAAWGTWNALTYFGLSYIEWLGIQDAVKAATSPFGRLAQARLSFGEGGSLFALRTKQMDVLAESWRQRGLDFVGPVDASRNRPDGSAIHWRMLFPGNLSGSEQEQGEAMLPFVIEWADDDQTRMDDLRTTGLLAPESTFRLAGVHMATVDVAAWIRRFRDYFGADAAQGELGKSAPFTEAEEVLTNISGTTLYMHPLAMAAQQLDNSRAGTFPGVFQLDLAHIDGDSDGSRKGSTTSTELSGLHVQVER